MRMDHSIRVPGKSPHSLRGRDGFLQTILLIKALQEGMGEGLGGRCVIFLVFTIKVRHGLLQRKK